jgi:preprotein translocase subunit SecG
VRVSKIKIYTGFGCENPALTCIVAGQVWGIIFIALSLVLNYVNFKDAKIKVNVVPRFLNRQSIEIYFKGIIIFRVVHIIIACLLLITAYFSVKFESFNKAKGAKKCGWTPN